MTDLESDLGQVDFTPVIRYFGEIVRISGQTLHIAGLNHRLGQGALIEVQQDDGRKVKGEVIGLEPKTALATLHGTASDLKIGQRVEHITEPKIYPSIDWIGRILNHEGLDIDGIEPRRGQRSVALEALPPPAIRRKALGVRLNTGVAAIDTFLPLCQGQRVGLFAGSGVGKSTLLGTIARSSNADITIIALIGERGREVRHFVDKILGPQGMKKSIVFAATSDMPSAIKLRTAQLAMATAEYFRDEGKQVLCLFDSLTRYAESHRDVALSAGEVPALKAFPPSTFRSLAALCERSGPGVDGSGDITAVFSVLVAGSDMEEPVADIVRGILDGHIILAREIAERGRFPAIDIRRSVSRSLPSAATAEENSALQMGREHIMRYEEAEAIIQAGLYVQGSDPKLDRAIEVYPALESFIGNTEAQSIEDSFKALHAVLVKEEEAST
ncbi:flagellum-specific ATP synthase [Litorimonas taeanensis]|uniref:Flagellum-specific ATP synthase n=1 Tax=Litorimonas taeanensis TaxID=568099 RepID=A0A420WM95_9PROT|nr:FliI/YscN family ATPase [Litorimonas taeanensis]RKQ72144.1 flagellum-specific ATP synthase [Litorimonas taeanensis]